MSGDRHFGEISALDPGPARPPLYELASSGLSESRLTTAGNQSPPRVGPAVSDKVNDGLVDLDWGAPEPAFVLRLRDAAGRDVTTRRVPMSPAPPAR
ncbi:MAG TPA: hypothetical protein VFS00_25350 [Polyangiaceae bacterium]|nr:hypothetical protein [Polyangiaceae bacterium]